MKNEVFGGNGLAIDQENTFNLLRLPQYERTGRNAELVSAPITLKLIPINSRLQTDMSLNIIDNTGFPRDAHRRYRMKRHQSEPIILARTERTLTADIHPS